MSGDGVHHPFHDGRPILLGDAVTVELAARVETGMVDRIFHTPGFGVSLSVRGDGVRFAQINAAPEQVTLHTPARQEVQR